MMFRLIRQADKQADKQTDRHAGKPEIRTTLYLDPSVVQMWRAPLLVVYIVFVGFEF